MGLLQRLKDRFGFFEYKINEHYIPAVDHQHKSFLPVTIIKGPFEGVTFSFENVQWHKIVASIAVNDGDAVPAGERMVATYDLKLIIKGLNNYALTTNNKRFKAAADDIWTDYAAFMVENHNKLRQAVLTDQTEEYPDEDYRTNDPQEFNHPRVVRKEGVTLPTARVRSTQKRKTTSGRDLGTLSKVQPTSDKGRDRDSD